MPPLSVMMKPSSSLCNIKCDYCFYCDEAKNREQESYGMMSETTLKNIIRKTITRSQGTITYIYQGGEPTLRGLGFFEKAIELENQYNRNNIVVNHAIQTNGIVIDEKWCEFLKKNNFLVGVSVDGITKTHNKYRHQKNGGGTYQRVFETTKLLDKYKVDYNVLTVVTKDVANNIEEIYKDYSIKEWNFQQYIACLEPLDQIRGENNYALTPIDFGIFQTKLFELWYQDYLLGKQPYIRQFENYVAIANGYRAEACDQKGHCSLQIVVESDGSVYPCDFFMLDEYKVGNFNGDRLDSIMQNKINAEFINRSLLIDPDCKTCEHYWICKGGCQRNREKIEGQNYYGNFLCEGFKYFFDNCMGKINSIKVSR